MWPGGWSCDRDLTHSPFQLLPGARVFRAQMSRIRSPIALVIPHKGSLVDSQRANWHRRALRICKRDVGLATNSDCESNNLAICPGFEALGPLAEPKRFGDSLGNRGSHSSLATLQPLAHSSVLWDFWSHGCAIHFSVTAIH